MNIIGFCGFIGAGKSEAARYIHDSYNYQIINYGDSLKDVVAAMFNWPRYLLEGDTVASRAFRNQVDLWWAAKLNIPHFTPRFALQNVGTDTIRHHFHKELWTLTVENKVDTATQDIVFGDIRHLDEIAFIRRRGGKIYRVKRGSEPSWYHLAECANTEGNSVAPYAINQLLKLGVHRSEYEWIGTEFDGVIENDGNLVDYHKKLDEVVNHA